ncbi:hypothetical protein HMH01_13190 [Halovulum dunhuangense]|uniref:DUF304 domain-containing protein n=1 Tax=Halovulum dunhuangense TaxID=1505036 RepID=A0A849L5I1_9RHOB|nr:hypothetical protein [Halovulum dunhuangense]NNU81391.1 hypothetical protein [Halovulum dunhuangense]
MTFAELMADPLRVVQNTETTLVIENRPVRRAAIAVGAILTAIAMGLAAIADGAIGTGVMVLAVVAVIGWLILGEIVHLTQIWLDRGADVVRWRTTTLRGRTEESLPLSDLSMAQVRTRYGPTAGTDRAHLTLVHSAREDRRETQIAMGRADAEEIARMAAVINAWLSRPASGDPA